MPRVRTRTLVVIATLIAVIAIGATAGVAITSGPSHNYRTATVTRGLVTRQLHGAGTLEPVAQASVAFPVAGTVNAVDVKMGDQVTTGAPLATLDTTSMMTTLLAKQATLASAQLNLDKALNGEPVGGQSSNGSVARTQAASTASASTTAIMTMAFTTPTSATSGSGSGSGGGSSPALAAAVERVASEQRAVDAAIHAEQRALAAAVTSCSASATPTTGGQSGGSTTTSTPSSTTPSSTPPPTVPAPSGSPNCLAAEQALLTAEQNVSHLQGSLAEAEHALERLLLSQKNGSGSTSGPASGPTSGSRSSSGANARGTQGGSSTSVSYSAEQLVAYQASVDAARAAVTAAQEGLQQATLVSPIDGTVVAVSMHTGDQVSASSATETIMIAGNGGYEVATTVDVNGIVLVKNGDTAAVVPDGASAPLHGKVVFIGTPSVTTASTSYPVVIGLTTSPNGLHNGATASTTIDVASSKVSALTVPTSAVHTNNGVHTVTVLSGNKTSTVTVQVGVVGATATEITSGLRLGETVVIADLGAAVPSSNADTRAAQNLTGGGALTGGNGGFGGLGR